MAQLFVLSGPDVGRVFSIDDGARVGRSPECAVLLKDRSISRHHAHFERRDGAWALVDDGSRNGIHRDSQRLARIELSDGSEFLLGEVLVRFRGGAPDSKPAVDPDVRLGAVTDAAARTPAPAPMSHVGQATGADDFVFEEAESIDLTASRDDRPPARPAAAARSGAAGLARPRLDEQRGRVLQYHRAADSGSTLSFDLAQLPWPQRMALVALALLVLAAVFAFALFGSSFLRGKVTSAEGAHEEVETEPRPDPNAARSEDVAPEAR